MSANIRICLKYEKLSGNMRKIIANILSCLNCQFQQSEVSARLAASETKCHSFTFKETQIDNFDKKKYEVYSEW